MWPLYSMKAANCKYFPFSVVEDDVNAKFSIKVTKVTLLTLVRVGHTIYVQSIHGICRYFAKGVSMDWPYYVCLILVKVSMESADTLSRGYPQFGHTMYVQHWSAEYPWNPWILCQGGIHGLALLCIFKVSVNNFLTGKQFVLPYNYVAVISYIQI